MAALRVRTWAAMETWVCMCSVVDKQQWRHWCVQGACWLSSNGDMWVLGGNIADSNLLLLMHCEGRVYELNAFLEIAC